MFSFNLGALLNYPIQVCIEGWGSDNPLHWFSFNGQEVVAEGRFLEAPGLPLFSVQDDAGRTLADTVPDEVAAIAHLMPAMDFELAQACAMVPAARELAEDSPLLFILMVDYARTQKMDRPAFARLIGCRRPVILDTLGFTGNKSLARLMRKLELSPLLPWELEDIEAVLTNPEFLALLRHHPNPHLNHLRFCHRMNEPFWPGMLSLIDRETSSLHMTWVCRMVRDTINLAGGNRQVLSPVRSNMDLQDVHDRYVIRFNRSGPKQREDLAAELQQEHGDYPGAPVPPIEGIEPLASWQALLEEGADMHHCVGSYDIPVAEREVFIYRMTSPERLTISLESRNHTWVIGEVRGRFNSAPSNLAMDILRQWVEN